MNFIMQGGIFMWPLLIIAIAVIVIAARKANDLYMKEGLSKSQLEKGINTILFWGSFSIILGFFAHFMGVYNAMMAIQQAENVSPAIVAGGYGMSLITILFGFVIFIVSLLIWGVFRARFNNLMITEN
ncbi:MAG: hypothetical protein SCALA702_36840 [Melioribacteraceae bacterium]|nr:MAG: hypothetical protein SCALA702_36840 [Melioribacteraceae bacterium]